MKRDKPHTLVIGDRKPHFEKTMSVFLDFAHHLGQKQIYT